jgi:hypothetical protein
MITDQTAEEWWSLCNGMLGKPLEPIEDYMMSMAPGQAGRMFIYDIQDNTAVATWVTLKHPGWIEPGWVKTAMKGTE